MVFELDNPAGFLEELGERGMVTLSKGLNGEDVGGEPMKREKRLGNVDSACWILGSHFVIVTFQSL